MRTIRGMLGNDEKVWVYLGSEDIWKRFIGMASAEGFHFGDLPIGEWTFGHVVSVHCSGEMGHLPLFIWCRSFLPDAENCPEKVDFLRFINGDKDYICKETHFTAAMIA